MCRDLTCVLLITLLAASHGAIACADDWGQFLGAQRNGISSEAIPLIDSFPPPGPKIVWKVPGGIGMSGVAVAEDLCITMANRGASQALIALDRETGAEKWTSPLAAAYENQMGNGPRATPTIGSENVYSYTGEGILTCNDLLSGKIVWQRNFPQELSSLPSEYGMSCSPLLFDNLVIVHSGGANAAVVAVDAATGKDVWTAGAGRAGYSSPTILNIAGKDQLISFLGGQCLGLDPKSGKILWSYAFVTDYDCNTATPIAVDGKVLISSGENHGSVLLQIEQNGDRFTAKEFWKSLGTASTLRSEWQTPLLVDGKLYGFDNIGSAGPVTNLTCVDASTGKTLWKKMRFGKSNGIYADGKLIITTMEGELVLVRATANKFEELDRAEVMGTTRQTPAISNGMIFVRDDTHITCIDLRK